jgi:uncharacterized protein
VVLVLRPGGWLLALAHWPMALVMIGGSLVAGSTPMGGGTVSFPALVLGFGRSPGMARDFGLAIQSVGMISALLFIVMRGIPIEKRLLLWSCAGAIVGLVFGTFLLATRVPAAWVKLLFATLWITFGTWMVTAADTDTGQPRAGTDREVAAVGLAMGAIGGAIMSLIGVGPEMFVYGALVLRFGWKPKAAVPTAVCATALAAPFGLLLRYLTAGIDAGVFPEWLAAMPLVIFGAPAGAYISTRLPRVVLLRIIAGLCLIQFLATVAQVDPTPVQWACVAAVSGAGLWLVAPSDQIVAEASGV